MRYVKKQSVVIIFLLLYRIFSDVVIKSAYYCNLKSNVNSLKKKNNEERMDHNLPFRNAFR